MSENILPPPPPDPPKVCVKCDQPGTEENPCYSLCTWEDTNGFYTNYIHHKCFKLLEKGGIEESYKCPEKKCRKVFAMLYNDKKLNRKQIKLSNTLMDVFRICIVTGSALNFAFIPLIFECGLQSLDSQCYYGGSGLFFAGLALSIVGYYSQPMSVDCLYHEFDNYKTTIWVLRMHILAYAFCIGTGILTLISQPVLIGYNPLFGGILTLLTIIIYPTLAFLTFKKYLGQMRELVDMEIGILSTTAYVQSMCRVSYD
jgi:hypothetical protein